VDNILFETDFPHPTCLYGNIAEKIAASLDHVSPEVRRKILWQNAAALYGIESPSPRDLARVPA
jgi:predicted TIM-barrel fold metal-dependent hydrolase